MSYTPGVSQVSLPGSTHSPCSSSYRLSHILCLACSQSMWLPRCFLQQAGLFCHTSRKHLVGFPTVIFSFEQQSFLWRSLWPIQQQEGSTLYMISCEKMRHSSKGSLVTSSGQAQLRNRTPLFLNYRMRQAMKGCRFLASAASTLTSATCSRVTMWPRLRALSMRQRQDLKSLLSLYLDTGALVRVRKRLHIPSSRTIARSRQVPQILVSAFYTRAGQSSTQLFSYLLCMNSSCFLPLTDFTGTKSSTTIYLHVPSLHRCTWQTPFQLAYWLPNSPNTRAGSSASMARALNRKGLVYLPNEMQVGSQQRTMAKSFEYILESLSNFSPSSWQSSFLEKSMVGAGGNCSSTKALPLLISSLMKDQVYSIEHYLGLQGDSCLLG